MVTQEVIKTLYRQFNKPPKSVDELNLALLFDYAVENHGIFLDEESLYIGSVDPRSPFATLPLSRINEIVEFETVIAVVLPAAIVFLNKEDSDVNIHIRLDDDEEDRSIWSKLKSCFKHS
ncbi:MAG: hypothetical protein K2L91_00380 [Duncaniella sp.]|nr:hypothetical protein [Duncaniella sp.]MDE6326963.1 hypothetical protein [Duncaniella sp.]MDE6465333.1 hypothetical protein [Duncaniella sp.]MDE6572948.1 hypothetical protein [Duncaniella sp.]